MTTAVTAVAIEQPIHPDALARERMLKEHLDRNSPPSHDDEKEPEPKRNS